MSVPKDKLLKPNSGDVVVIIGVGSLVGIRLAQYLLELGVKVIGVDRLSAKDEKDKIARKLKDATNFEYIHADVNKKIPIGLKRRKFTHILHVSDIFPYIGDRGDSLDEILNNSLGLKNTLDLASKHDAKCIYTSSVDIYQGLASHESLDNYFDGPELSSYYGFLEAKRYGETLCHEYVDKFDLDVRIARMPEVYGPEMNLQSSSLLRRMLRLALDRKDLIIDEEGSFPMHLLYVDDAAYGLMKLLFTEDEDVKQSILYFSNQETISVISVAYTLRELVNNVIKIDFLPKHRKVTLPRIETIDSSRTQTLLGWQPEISLTEGLRRTIEWFEKHNISADYSITNPQHTSTEEEPTIAEIGSIMEAEEEGGAEDMLEDENMHEQSSVAENVDAVAKKKDDAPLMAAVRDLLANEKEDNHSPAREAESSTNKDKKQKKGWLAMNAGGSANIARKISQGRQGLLNLQISIPQVFVFLFVVMFFLLIPIFVTGGFLLRAGWDFQSQNYRQMENSARNAGAFFRLYRVPAYLLQLDSYYQPYEDTIQTLVYGARTAAEAKKVAQPLNEVLDRLMDSWINQGQSGENTNTELNNYTIEDLEKALQEALVYVPALKTNMNLLASQVGEINTGKMFPFIGEKIVTARNYLFTLEPIIQNSDQLLLGFPKILGYTAPQNYLIWFQNSEEIRPIGGFIGSYAKLDVNKGQVTNFAVDDIYNPDGLIQEHSDPAPPAPLKEYLGVDFLGVRDANWWPHMPTSAEIFIRLYEDVTEEKIDGIVAINLEIMRSFLTEIGEIFIPTYDETITAENVFERAQFHAEVGFEPGSTQKKDFLATLAAAIINKMAEKRAEIFEPVAKVIGESVLAHEAIIYFTDSETQKVVEGAQIAGEMIPIPPNSDYLRVVDTNIGGNKANYWVDRKTEYAVDVARDGILTGNIHLTWQHRGTSRTWPNGDYVNYVRIYVPKLAHGTEVEVNPPLKDQQIRQIYQRTEISGIVEVPIDTAKTLQLTYKLPTAIGLAVNTTYQLVWENQPGITPVNNFNLRLPSFLSSTYQTSLGDFTLDQPQWFEIPVSGTEAIKMVPAVDE